MKNRFTSAIAIAGLVLTLMTGGIAHAQGVLRIAMTASDVPLPNGQTDQGAEGMRFIGYTLFDSLVLWDLTSADKPASLTPGLASEWSVDARDKTHWTFKIRKGVRFHDGSAFTAQAAVWNFDKILSNNAPQFDTKQAAQGRTRIPTVKSYRALDDHCRAGRLVALCRGMDRDVEPCCMGKSRT